MFGRVRLGDGCEDADDWSSEARWRVLGIRV